MHLLAPDLLELTRQLSPGVSGAAVAVGLALWLFGLRHHRFWLAVAVTLAAGAAGLFVSRDFGLQPLIAGLLLALAAGVLAVSLARLALFAAGGVAAVLATRAAATGWNELVCFVLGGLLGVGLYPVWVAALSSLAGTLLVAYGLASLLDRLGQLDSIAWASANRPLLNWAVGGAAVAGMLLQLLVRRRSRPDVAAKKKVKQAPAAAPPPPPPPAPAPPPPPWWRPWERRAA